MDNTGSFRVAQIRYFRDTFKPLEVADNVRYFADETVPEADAVSLLTDNPEKRGDATNVLRAFRHAVVTTREEFMAAHTHHFSGLPNRRLFEKAAGEELEMLGTKVSQGTAVIMLDVDQLKAVNDNFGMQAGDDLLTAVAQRVGSKIEGKDIVSHFGGDEFAVLIADSDGVKAQEILENVRAAFDDFTLQIKGATIPVGASMGMAIAKPGDAYSETMAAADKAMKENKAVRAPARGDLLVAIVDSADEELTGDK